MVVYRQQFTTMQGCVQFWNGVEWNGMVPFQRNGMVPSPHSVWIKGRNGMVPFLFAWGNWRAERNEVKLIFCLKIVINNSK